MLTFRSLGTEPELVLTLADRGRFDALAWGLALAVGLFGVAMTNRPVRRKISFIFAVALLSTLLPLVWDDLAIVRTCNMVFFAAAILVPYYLLAGLLKWSLHGLCRACCSCAVPSKVVAAGLLVVLLAALAGGAAAQTAKEGSPTAAAGRITAEQKIEAALYAPVTLNFTDTPLTDVVDKLKARNKIAIQLDKKALDAAGINSGVQLTFSVKGVSLRSALRRMLHQAGLTYLIEHEAILITTPDEAGNHLTTVAYPVTDLVEMTRDAAGNVVPGIESLSDVIRSTIEPTTWDEVGGPGAIAPGPRPAARSWIFPRPRTSTGRSPPCCGGSGKRSSRPPAARRTVRRWACRSPLRPSRRSRPPWTARPT